MQLTKTLVIVAVAFTASASAAAVAPAGRSAALAARGADIQAMINKASGDAQLVRRFGVPTFPPTTPGTPSPAITAINAAIDSFQEELVALEALGQDITGNVADAAGIFKDIVDTFTTLLATLAGVDLPGVGVDVGVDANLKQRSVALVARQGGLVGAVTALGESLQAILTQVQDFIGTALSELGLGTVKNLVDAIFEPVLGLVSTISDVLDALAPGLAGIVDPLLKIISDIAAALGIDLNLPPAMAKKLAAA